MQGLGFAPDRGAGDRSPPRRGAQSQSRGVQGADRSPTSPDAARSISTCPEMKANSTGAKGVGEPPLVPTAPAVANAIFDAIGMRIRASTALRGSGCSATSRPERRMHESIRLRAAELAGRGVSRCSMATDDTRFLAGGTDLLTLMKHDIATPRPAGGHQAAAGAGRSDRAGGDGGLRIGALATLAQIEGEPLIRDTYRGPGRGGLARRDPATAEHGDDRRQPAPAAALLVLPQRAIIAGSRAETIALPARARTSITPSSATAHAWRSIPPTWLPPCSRSMPAWW